MKRFCPRSILFMFCAALLLGACERPAAIPGSEVKSGDASVLDPESDGGWSDRRQPRASESFLIGREATEKAYWPGHPIAVCILDEANNASVSRLLEFGLSHVAAESVVSHRGAGILSLDALDLIPHVGHAALARLEDAALGSAACACDRVTCAVDPRSVQLGELFEHIRQLQARQGNASELRVDSDLLEHRMTNILARSAGTPTGYAHAVRVIGLAFPNGHAGAFDPLSNWPYSGFSPFQVCARPGTDGFVVTHAAPENELGLFSGDLVTSVDGRVGDGLERWILEQPMNAPFPASDSGFAHQAALALFAVLRPGAVLSVTGVDGLTRDIPVDVIPSDLPALRCDDPFARDRTQDVYVSLRRDGIVVVRLPDLTPSGAVVPTTLEEALEHMRILVDRIATAFAEVRDDATGVIWDLRGNGGGSSPVGFAIVQGFESTRELTLSSCERRIQGTNNFVPGGGQYSIAPGEIVSFDSLELDVGDVFQVDVPTAVLVDGGAVSAGDYFALAVRRATRALLVGKPTAGGYGSSSLPLAVGPWSFFSDTLLCSDSAGVPLETYGVEVDIDVDYRRDDLVIGRDSVEEAAAEAILACGGSDCAERD